MPVKLKNYLFEGPFFSINRIEDRSGIYAILSFDNEKIYVIDIGESSEVKTRLENHDRKDCWEKNCRGTFTISVYYTPNLQQSGRKLIEQELRDWYDPVCGDR